MRLRVAFASAITFAGLCGVAQADIIAGGPVYGGPAGTGGQVVCRLFNAGFLGVTVASRQIFSNTNVLMPLASDSCTAGLPPNRYCAFAANITGNLAFSCKAVILGTDVNVRGVAEIKNSSSAVLNAVPMD